MSGLRFKRPLASPLEAWLWVIYHAPITTTQRALADEWGWAPAKAQRLIEKWKSMQWIDANGSRAGTLITLGISAPLPSHALGHREKPMQISPAPDANISDEIDLLGGPIKGTTTRRATPTRLTAEFRFPVEWIDYAESKGMPREEARQAAYEWRLYWIGEGKKKANWQATWQRRVRDLMKWKAEREAPGGDGMMAELKAKYGQ